VQMRMNDGRVFEADRDVTIHLPPPSQRRTPPPDPQPMVPPPEETLPKPRPADGPSIDTSAKPKFNEVRREPLSIPTSNDLWHSAPPTPTVRMERPIADNR